MNAIHVIRDKNSCGWITLLQFREEAAKELAYVDRILSIRQVLNSLVIYFESDDEALTRLEYLQQLYRLRVHQNDCWKCTCVLPRPGFLGIRSCLADSMEKIHRVFLWDTFLSTSYPRIFRPIVRTHSNKFWNLGGKTPLGLYWVHLPNHGNYVNTNIIVYIFYRSLCDFISTACLFTYRKDFTGCK